MAAVGIAVFFIVCMVGMYLALRPKADVATGPEGANSAGAIPAGPTPAAAASVAANDPGPAPPPVAEAPKATAPSVGVTRGGGGGGGRPSAAPAAGGGGGGLPAMPAMPMPAAPTGPQTLEGAMGAAAGTVKPAAPTAPSSGTSEPFDRGAAAASLGSIDVSNCKKTDGPTGSGHVRITFSPNGTVQSAIVDQPPFAGTAVGGCVAGKFRSAHVPPFGGGPTPVGKSFVIN